MRWRTFLFYNALGGGVWVTAAVLVGYLLGEGVDFLEWWMGRTSLLLLGLVAVGLGFYFAHRWSTTHRSWLTESPDHEQRGQQNDETSE